MKLNKLFLTGALALLAVGQSLAQSLSPSTRWHWNEGTIVVDTPQRPAGQENVLGLTAPKLQNVRVAFVGLGMRGPGAVERFCHIPGVEIVALCDYEAKRAARMQQSLQKAGLPPAAIYSGEKGYEELCRRPDIDLVYVATDWDHHFPVAKCALENGKHTAIEVPSAMNLEQCWELINLSEKTRKHCMILENCCYDWYELNALNMAQQGVFGEVLRAEGAYIHNLDEFWDYYWKNPDGSDPQKLGWRMKYNMENRGDVYATHGLGPVAQVLDIHRGDRFTTLVAMDTKAAHGPDYVEAKTGTRPENFRNGDQTTTLMRTANGKVVEIQHNVMNPQPYNRLYKLTGTKGYATKYPEQHFALDKSQLSASGVAPKVDDLSSHGFLPAAEHKALMEKYQHPIITKYGEMAQKVGGHGGMDFFMDARLVYCLQNGLPLDMDVYDLAEWCCLAELGTLSMDHNCAAVEFPDFTRGYWNVQKGYKHAYAADEAETEAIASKITDIQKSFGEKAWEEYATAKSVEEANAISAKYVGLVQAEIDKLNGKTVETKKAKKTKKSRR
ncbi:MAG: Gfo/Idh/MocA family oxidoreductase [Alloprevotella sp.]|nr:Gfo/Idh/MocA family oxidoreductase [Alloprevotella sp.]